MENKKLMSPMCSGTIIGFLVIGAMILLGTIPTAFKHTYYWTDAEFLTVVCFGGVLVLGALIALLINKKRLDI